MPNFFIDFQHLTNFCRSGSHVTSVHDSQGCSAPFYTEDAGCTGCYMKKMGMPRCSNEIYFERQAHGSTNCQVHAINNTFGDCIFTPEALQGFIEVMRREDTDRAWDQAYEAGGFSDDLIQMWLQNSCLALHQVGNIPARCPNICSRLTQLSNAHTCNAFLCRAHHHAFAVKKTERNKWVLLDSLLPKPVSITSSTPSTDQLFIPFKLCSTTPSTPHSSDATPINIYMEKQEKAFCLVHAFNMALGRQALEGGLILTHILQMENTLIDLNIRDVDLKLFYDPGMGNFNSMIVSHYLAHCPWNRDSKLYLTYEQEARDLQPGQISAELLESLTNSAAHSLGAILTTVNRGQTHAVALKNLQLAMRTPQIPGNGAY